MPFSVVPQFLALVYADCRCQCARRECGHEGPHGQEVNVQTAQYRLRSGHGDSPRDWEVLCEACARVADHHARRAASSLPLPGFGPPSPAKESPRDGSGRLPALGDAVGQTGGPDASR